MTKIIAVLNHKGGVGKPIYEELCRKDDHHHQSGCGLAAEEKARAGYRHGWSGKSHGILRPLH